MRYAALLLVLLIAGIGNVWGASPYNLDITSAFSSTGNQSKNDGTVTVSGYIQSKTYNNTGSTKVAYLDGSNYLTVSATSACITSISITANTDNGSNTKQVAYQTSANGSSWSANTNMGTCAARVNSPTTRTVNFAEAVQYVRFQKGENNSISVGYISVTYSSCDAANLTASNITSNGNQEAGTGITFSKVGSPVSGDTWYWQTSSTGTDKTYNATSSYTTATTAGSYTVYLRAYNSAGDCWGTAASMTNTIYPAPSAMIHNRFAVNDAWSSTIATQDKTNITSLNAMAAVGESVGSGSNKSGLTQKIPSQSSEDAGKYMSLSFNVAAGKQLNVTSVVFDEQPVTATGTFKVSISDNQGSTTKTQTIASGAAGSKHTLTLDGDIVGSFKGTVTVKVWAYGWSDGYRFGDYFYINGTVTASASSWSVLGSWDSWVAGTSLTGSGTVSGTVSLAADTRYEFKFKEGETWYGNGGTIITTTDGWVFTSGGFNSYIHTGPAGDYTFAINTSTKAVTITYPTVSHPNDHYVYFKNSDVWGTVKGYLYNNGNDNKSAAWPGSDMQATTTICGELYHYAAMHPMSGTYNTIIFNNGSSGYGNQTSDLSTTGSLGKFNANRDAAWHDLAYTISFNNGGGSGSMSSITGICPNSNQLLPENTFTKTDYVFAGWHANVATKVGGSTIAAGGDIADEATLQEINSNITLTAQWTACSGPTITAEAGMAGYTYTQGGVANTMTITASAGNGGTLHYHWYQYNVGQNPLTQSIDAVGGTDANTYTPSTASAHEGQIFYCVVSEEGCSTTVQSAYSGAITVIGAVTYTVTYDGSGNGGGSVPVDGSSPYTTGSTVTVLGNTGSLTKTMDGNAATFYGWNTNSNTYGGTHYDAGNTFTITSNTILYAVWGYPLNYNLDGGTINESYPTYYISIWPGSGDITVLPTNVTKTGYTFAGWKTQNGAGSTVTAIDGNYTGAFAGDYALKATWTAKTTTITINANTANHGSTTPGTVTATFGSTLPSFTAASGASGYVLTGYYTAATDGTKIINADGTLVRNTAYSTDEATPKWNSDVASLTLYAQYEESDGCHKYFYYGVLSAPSPAPTKNEDSFFSNVPSSGSSLSGSWEIDGVTYTTSNRCSNSTNIGTFTVPAGKVATMYVMFNGSSSYTMTIKKGGSNYKTGIDASSGIKKYTEEDMGAGTYAVTTSGNVGLLLLIVDVCDAKPNATVYSFSNGSFTDWGTCNGGTLTLSGSQSGVSYQLYKDGVASGDAKAGTGSALNWTVTASGTYTVKSVENASYAETAMTGSAVVTLQDPTLSGSSTVNIGSTITLTHPGYLISGGSWTSSNGSVATVVDGVVTGVAAGTATITFHGVGACDGSKLITVTEAVTYAVTYHDHRPSGSQPATKTGSVPATANYAEDAEVTVAGNTGSLVFEIEGAAATFRGWNTNANGFSGTFYAPGATFDMPAANVDLYAVWSYPIEYNEDGGTINDDPYATYYIYTNNTGADAAIVTATLPTNVTKAGYEFDGWYSNNGAGSKLTGVTGGYTGPFAGDWALKAKWTKASDCVTLTHFGKQYRTSDPRRGYAYAGSTSGTKYIIESNKSDNKNTSSDSTALRLNYNSYIRVLNSGAVSDITDSIFENVSSISFKWKFHGSSTDYTTSVDVYVGGVKVLNAASLTGNNTDAYRTQTISISPAKNGTVKIVNNSPSGDSKYSLWLDDISICSADDCSDPEVTAAATETAMCSGSTLTITATGAHAFATYQWQKQNGSSWDNISGATSATYTVASAKASNAGTYRVVASHDCDRTSNTVTITVAEAPAFGAITSPVSVMTTTSLIIADVEATNANSYKWYKSADATLNVGTDEQVGSAQTLNLSVTEAAGSTFYLFCVATNACGSDISSAIAVNVTAYVEQDCATRGNEGEAEFEFDYGSAGQGSYSSTAVWTMNDNSKILTYTAPDGKYFKTAKVTIASSNQSKASYNWSINGGSTYTSVALTVNSTLTERTINLSAHGNVDKFQIGRNFNSTGASGGTLYVSKICFEYTEACTATTVTPSTSSKTHTIGNSFTEPIFTVKHGDTAFDPQPTITYSSSDEDIATVDDDGAVTFQGMAGTVRITASYAGGTISATDYCASEGYYTITVSCSAGTPSIAAGGSTNLSGCNASVTLTASGVTSGGTYQWFRNGNEVDGATSASITVTQAGTYTVEYTKDGCTSLSSNSIAVTSTSTQPEVERLVPFQYYHVDKTYTAQMKMRHLFAVKNSGELDGKSFKLYVSRNGGAATDVTSSVAISVLTSGDGTVDTVMVDLNKLIGKYAEDDELVYTCKAIDCEGEISEVYKATIQMHVIDETPTLALICSGADKDGNGTRKTSNMVVGGDFLTGYNPADLCQQTGNTSFNKDIEWGLYTELKAEYIVTPVNGYAVFNKLNYEPFDILFLTDYPKASHSDAAKTILDNMADLCDYRPLFSFKTHMVAKNPSKWAAKGFTTSPEVTKSDGRLNLNIVCYAHPMFEDLKTGEHVYNDNDDRSELVYTMLSGEGYESGKGMQGFHIEAAENFVTIGLTHYNATAAINTPTGYVTWTSGDGDEMLVTVAERQANIEARMILFSLNAGAHSKLTDKGEHVVLACLEYLLDTDPLHVADCALTFDNGAGYTDYDAGSYSLGGEKGDGKWSTPANWGPNYLNIPGPFSSARVAAHATVDIEDARAMDIRLLEGGHITIPAGKALEVTSTIRHMDGTEISPTENSEIYLGSNASGNGSLIFNNDKGDTKATVAMYTTAKTAEPDPVTGKISAAASTWQYIGTPHKDVTNARSNYYDSWLYQYDTGTGGWIAIPNGGTLMPFHGYCVTHPEAGHTFIMTGTLAETTSQDIEVPAGKYVVAANSWVAPIDINEITDDDMEDITDKSIYFFNTGTDTEGTGSVSESATGVARWAAGTYVSVPIHSAPYTDGSDDHIPSMQGFYVVGGSSNGTLHLDYSKHVRGTTRGSIVSGRMHAPKRVAEENEPEVVKLYFRGSRYDDRLIILEREDFTRGYDSGWDGEAWGGSDLSPMAYVSIDGRYDAVSAIPEYEGTVVGFRAGEDDEFTIDFVYDADSEPLYIYDTEERMYIRVLTGNAYHFTTNDKAYHERFILTRKTPYVTTGFEPIDGDESAKAKKLLIENKMYILLNGLLYDATGKVVK